MANRKISDLTALTTPATGDLLPIVDISEAAAADKNKKITYGELLASAPLGSAAAPSIAFEGDNTGIYSPGADQLAIATGGTGRLFVDASGRVGVGNPVAGYQLSVNGSIYIQGSSTAQIRMQSASGSGSWYYWGENTVADRGVLGYAAGSGDLVYRSGAFDFASGSERLRIDSSGRLLVGTSSALDTETIVPRIQSADAGNGAGYGAFRYSANAPGPLLHFFKSRGTTVGTNTIVVANDVFGQIRFTGADGTNEIVGASIEASVDGTPGTNDMPGRLVFSTTADGASTSTERMRITSAGNVGIGTTSPSTKLVVEDSSAFKIAVLRTGTAVVGMGVESGPYVYSDGALQFRVGATAGGSADERMRIDTSGRLLVGTSASTHQSAPVQIVAATTSLEHLAGSNSAGDGAYIFVSRSRGTAASRTGVQNNDNIAKYAFYGYSGAASAFSAAAEISVWVDGEPDTAGDTTDMPGRLVFSTTADGAASLTEALRITNDRVIAYNQPAPTSKSAAATLTITELKTRIIEYTGAAATLTLPTGTLMEGGFSGIYTNMAFEWSVINTGAGICTIGAGTAHTIVGSATVAIGASARFVSRRTAANTFVSYRLS